MKAIKPQAGFQEQFLSSAADIVIGGGAAGAGKTFAELIEAVRHIGNPKFGAVMFRRTYAQIKNEGGLWDASKNIYPLIGGRPNESDLTWKFRTGATISFAHLQHEKDIFNYQGSEIPLIIFDELTHFTERMFFYLLSRNRSTCGVRPYIRATCNPDPDSWVARFIDWYIDSREQLPDGSPNPSYGLPIPERVGKIRYFLRDQENVIWGDSVAEVVAQCPHIFSREEFKDIDPRELVKSFTFIPGTIYGNTELLRINPGYLGNLMSLDEATKSQLLDGNWGIKLDGLALFNFIQIQNIFSNYPDPVNKYLITCDAARFGVDLAVIMVWQGWEMVKLVIWKKSDATLLKNEIEKLRREFRVEKTDVIVDQDGVGGGVVKLGGYLGFSGGSLPVKEREDKFVKEAKKRPNYKNLKTQLYFLVAEENVNVGNIRITITNENVIVDGVYGCKIMLGGKLHDVRDLIKADLKAIKRAKTDIEGRLQINTKEEQKAILGRSPDFGDNIMMRKYFDLRRDKKYIGVSN